MRIAFLIHHAYGIGGTIRTTFNSASALAEQHDVEVVSVFRHRDRPALEPGPEVRLRHLVDLRPGSPGFDGEDPEHARPARRYPRADGHYGRYSGLTDRRVTEYLRSTDADVVVGTRPGINTQIARYAPPGPVLVGQEHLTLACHSRRLRLTLRDAYPRLDALTTVTETDARDYRSRMRLPGVRVEAVPNGVPAPRTAPADPAAKWVIAAGRLAPAKRFDLLLRAFAQVVAERPDWRLRIYGAGPQRERLRACIDHLELYNHAFLMGPAHPIESEWLKGSLAASSSSLESFGMTIVEAMRCGLPVVATRCPHGPAEIIRDGEDGRLVAVNDPDALAAGLLGLISDEDLRRRMGRAAIENARRYDPARVAERYTDLFTALLARRGRHSRLGRLRAGLHRTRGAALGTAFAARDGLRHARAAVRGATARSTEGPAA
ncbi:glycosyltransferase family 4 protein [Streptomyces sp. TRM 70351]|uniref:glycosyltransferase family 4 protein n=1 Tax=Streptomyces sp. TRM 70351 TaxID=3116552 RepID=UPI002E7BFFE0|nr:glycosyltransferase family 4 protein [Streptomyces sp. TRM 70351]MEE1928936.1 glycosyltransferase family 4 protein [Streptomyces sp. TRM 70351]